MNNHENGTVVKEEHASLQPASGMDDFQRPIAGLDDKGKNIIQPVVTFTVKTTLDDVRIILGDYAFADTVVVFMNGVGLAALGDTNRDLFGKITYEPKDKYDDLANKTMDGLLIEVFATGKEIDVVSLIAYSLGIVTIVDEKNGTVKIESVGFPLMDAYPYEATGFKVNDIVVFTDSFDVSAMRATIQSATLAPRVTAVLTSYSGSTSTGGSFVADGNTYKYSAVNTMEQIPVGHLTDAPNYIAGGGAIGDEVTIFLDSFGYAIHIVNALSPVDSIRADIPDMEDSAEVSQRESQQDSEMGTTTVGTDAIAGNWSIVVQVPGGEQKGVFDFRVDGNSLEGSMTNDDGVTNITDGRIKGNEFYFKIKLKTPVGQIKFTVTGTVAGDKISGKWKMVVGALEFSGVRA